MTYYRRRTLEWWEEAAAAAAGAAAGLAAAYLARLWLRREPTAVPRERDTEEGAGGAARTGETDAPGSGPER